MKKVYSVLSALLLAVVLVIGVVALLSSKDGVSAPKLSFGGLLNGKYSAARRDYYAQRFPESESMEKMNTRLNGFYKFSGFGGSEDVQLIINMDSEAANGGASLNQTTTPDTSEPPVSEPDTSESTQPTETEPPEPSDGPGEDAVVEDLGSALLIGNRAVEVPYANNDCIRNYAATVTAIANALGNDVRVFNIAVPNAAEFYTTKDFHTGSNSQKDMIDLCYENLGDNVTAVDAYSQLSAHVDEYIYFRTDHHWTQLGAYYSYVAFCEAAGFEASDLSRFEQGKHDPFVGSMYSYLSDYPQAAILKNDPDVLYYYRPYVEIDTTFYMDATLDTPYIIGTISHLDSNVSNKYLCFLGGDHPVTIIETDVEGPVCLIMKESFGNAFTPWLTSHYSKVIAVDPREFNRDGKPSMDLVQFAKEQCVDDMIILNYCMMLNSNAYVDWMGRMIE